MTLEQVERRLSAVERELAEVRQQAGPMAVAPGKAGLLAAVGALAGDPDFPTAMAWAAYVRRTGQPPPAGWQPGDPLPASGDRG